ncbi:MAG: hypothetical protein EPO16_04745 [Dehalococcoidia bacterium]|nr:MAG: hypothetical protein EPO16_04745 [Dehalococcoidia bacterium]
MSATTEYVRKWLASEEAAGRPQSFLTAEGGPVSYEDARAYLDELTAQGLRFVPSCDNTDAEGRCAGHEEARP